MKTQTHTYLQLCKEEKYINNMLNKGYKLIQIEGTKSYIFEECEPNQYTCKVLLVDENDYAYIEKICAYTEMKGLIKVDAFDKKQNIVRVYVFAENETDLYGLPDNREYVINEYQKAINKNIQSVSLGVALMTVFLFSDSWLVKLIAIIEGILALISAIQMLQNKKQIKILKKQMQGD